jgi:hypothetical protein
MESGTQMPSKPAASIARARAITSSLVNDVPSAR